MPHSQTITSKHILIVDDKDFDRKLIFNFLKVHKIDRISTATSGHECLTKMSEAKVDLVLLDSNMPELSGLETLKKIREKFNSIELPVIFLTGNSDSEDVVLALQAGANDYITKPLPNEIAWARISTHIDLSRISSEMAALKRIEAVHAMIVTYNHKINTPLATALLCLDSDNNDHKTLERAKKAVLKISEIVKKIAALMNDTELDYESYAVGKAKMVKLKEQ